MKLNLTLEALQDLLERRDAYALQAALEKEHPADLAELLEGLAGQEKLAAMAPRKSPI